MLSYDDALERILATVAGPLDPEIVMLSDALGRALDTDRFAPTDLPPFDNSMVDGFAVCSRDPARRTFPLLGESVAGGGLPEALPMDSAIRIYTGAPVPGNTTGIVMQEDCAVASDGQILCLQVPSPSLIRRAGSDLPAGDLAVPAGATLSPGEIGLLAALNSEQVSVVRKPRVGLLTTGDELVSVGETPLRPGAIRDSIGPALTVAIAESGAIVHKTVHATDSPGALDAALDSLTNCDVILSVGGVSVGARDFVKAAIERRGQLDFWRVAIKPGKPLAFGRLTASPNTQHPKPKTHYVGLPGNPVSALVTFELFVRPLLRKLGGHARVYRPTVSVTLADGFSHEPGRREFVRARLAFAERGLLATPTGAQGSHRLHSMVGVDALLIAHETRGDYEAGETIPALLLRA